jgi:t-SNARE complex subunit (syntaxin)
MDQELKKQDDHLELISRDMLELANTANKINYELNIQNKIIDDINCDVERADTKLVASNHSITKILLMDKNNCCYLWISIILFIIFIILLLVWLLNF